MLLDLIDLSKLRRAIIYAILLAVVFAFQDLLAAQITIMGVKAVMIPAAVVAIGLFEGGMWGGLIGIAAGYFCDLGYTEQLVLFTVLLSVSGFFSGVLGKYLLHKGFVSYMALVLVTLMIVTFCQMFRFLLFTDTDAAAVWRTGLIQIAWSLPWAIPLYFPCKAIAGHAMDT